MADMNTLSEDSCLSHDQRSEDDAKSSGLSVEEA